MKVDSLVVYDDGRMLHVAKVMHLDEHYATIVVFRTAQPNQVITVSRERLSLVHEQEKPA